MQKILIFTKFNLTILKELASKRFSQPPMQLITGSCWWSGTVVIKGVGIDRVRKRERNRQTGRQRKREREGEKQTDRGRLKMNDTEIQKDLS